MPIRPSPPSAAVNTSTPGKRASLSAVDGKDPSVRPVRAHERRVPGARQPEVIDVLAVSGQEAGILAAADGVTEHHLRLIAPNTQATKTPWKGSRAHRLGRPPGTLG